MNKFCNWFSQLLMVNLFITIVSLPILIAWGLPLSWLSPIGNLIFTPFLSLFLLLSTAAFFIALCGISQAPFDWAIEWLHWIWHHILAIAPDHTFVGFSTSGFVVICLISTATFFLIILPFFCVPRNRIMLLISLFACSVTTLKILQPSQITDAIIGKNKPVQLFKNDSTTILIDSGAFAEHGSPSNWVQYHLIPEIIKKTGSTAVDYLIITRPTIRSFEAAAALMKHSSIGTIFYPEITGTLTGSHRGAFRKWYAIAKEKKVQLKIVRNKPIEIEMGNRKMVITPDKKMKYREVVYPLLKIC